MSLNSDAERLAVRRSRLIDGFLLVLILLLAFFMAFVPHLDYGYPLHVDEWWRWGDAQGILEAGRITYPDPFEAGETVSPDIEVGFHVFLAEIKLITGVSWLSVFRFLPGLMLSLIVFQAYALGRSRGIGLQVAFLVALMPTTVRFLGPSFVVPVSLGLLLVPPVLLVLDRLMRDGRGPAILFLMLLTALFVHPPTLAVLSGLVAVYSAMALLPWVKRKPGLARNAAISLVLMASVLVVMVFWAPSYVDFVFGEAMDPARHLPLPPIRDAVTTLGLIPAALFVVGAGILSLSRRWQDWALLISAAGLLAYQLVYPYVYLGPDIVYERGWLFIFLLMAVPGGVALKAIREWARHAQRLAPVAHMLVGAIVIGAFALALWGRVSEPFYRLIDDVTYADFAWVKEYVPDEYRAGLSDTNTAWAFAAASGKTAYTAEVFPNLHDKGRSAMQFLDEGMRDTTWLTERGISIVYWSGPVENGDLIKVGNNLYLLPCEE